MRPSIIVILKMVVALTFTSACKPTPKSQEPLNLLRLGTKILPGQDREYSYTDKQSGYYYGMAFGSHQHLWFSGWNVNTHRILKDYSVQADDKSLDRQSGEVTVYPHQLVRKYNRTTETFQLVDHLPVLSIQLKGEKNKTYGIALDSTFLKPLYVTEEGSYFEPMESAGHVVLLAPQKVTPTQCTAYGMTASATSGGFVLVYAPDISKANGLLQQYRDEADALLLRRQMRMEQLIATQNRLQTKPAQTENALQWMMLTLDQLITEQQGKGIYAGLPWFNQYWGRDMFISFPGACLVTGQFEVAKEILCSFAQFQDTLPDSETFGRIPNRAQPTDIIYNTTDGTPRFVQQIMEYVQYSGDTLLIEKLFPAVERSIEGALKNWVDAKGYLTHEDADTWMDAKKKGTTPYSPRGAVANDIQSLWYQQLMAGARMAHYMGKPVLAEKWKNIALKLKTNFQKEFWSQTHGFLADRIATNGKKDFKLRPNQLYAYELLDNASQKASITQKVWQGLVYPWGVASLSQEDPDFYPYHENWHYYHKDAAYHNGTVWLWNNGAAMQRMIEHNQHEKAWKLFKNMSHQALEEGAVGSLSENSDAIPREGMTRGKLSGTFLQAWSNAEQIRVFYQDFLGIRPNLPDSIIGLTPRIPKELKSLDYSVRLGNGKMDATYASSNDREHYVYTFSSYDGEIRFDMESFDAIRVRIRPGDTMEVIANGAFQQLTVHDNTGKTIRSTRFSKNVRKWNEEASLDSLFQQTDFCKPVLQPQLKSLQHHHPEALTY